MKNIKLILISISAVLCIYPFVYLLYPSYIITEQSLLVTTVIFYISVINPIVWLIIGLFAYTKTKEKRKIKMWTTLGIAVFTVVVVVASVNHGINAYKDIQQGAQLYTGNCELQYTYSRGAPDHYTVILKDINKKLETNSITYYQLENDKTCNKMVQIMYFENLKLFLGYK